MRYAGFGKNQHPWSSFACPQTFSGLVHGPVLPVTDRSRSRDAGYVTVGQSAAEL